MWPYLLLVVAGASMISATNCSSITGIRSPPYEPEWFFGIRSGRHARAPGSSSASCCWNGSVGLDWNTTCMYISDTWNCWSWSFTMINLFLKGITGPPPYVRTTPCVSCLVCPVSFESTDDDIQYELHTHKISPAPPLSPLIPDCSSILVLLVFLFLSCVRSCSCVLECFFKLFLWFCSSRAVLYFLIKILFFYKTLKYWYWKTSAVSTTGGWLKLDFARCVIRQTRSLGALVLCSICNMVFVNYIYDEVVDTQFNKFHGRPFARVLHVLLMKYIGRWLPWVLPGSTGRSYNDDVVHDHFINFVYEVRRLGKLYFETKKMLCSSYTAAILLYTAGWENLVFQNNAKDSEKRKQTAGPGCIR